MNSRSLRKQWGGLVDRGANGGIAGMETLILERYDDYVDCQGMANHTVSNLKLVKGAVVTRSIGKGGSC